MKPFVHQVEVIISSCSVCSCFSPAGLQLLWKCWRLWYSWWHLRNATEASPQALHLLSLFGFTYPFPPGPWHQNTGQQILSNWHGEWSQPDLCQVPVGLCSSGHGRPGLHRGQLCRSQSFVSVPNSSGGSYNRNPLTFILEMKYWNHFALPHLSPLFPVRNSDSETVIERNSTWRITRVNQWWWFLPFMCNLQSPAWGKSFLQQRK